MKGDERIGRRKAALQAIPVARNSASAGSYRPEGGHGRDKQLGRRGVVLRRGANHRSGQLLAPNATTIIGAQCGAVATAVVRSLPRNRTGHHAARAGCYTCESHHGHQH
jgi:hypothetical protein